MSSVSPALLRRFVFWTHLAAGLTAGSVVFVMSVTGVLLTYERQLLRWAETSKYGDVQAPPDTVPLTPDAIVQAARTVSPEAPATALTVYADPQAPASVAFGARTVHVNPYTGQVLGEPGRQPRAFFRRVTDWHRWLGASPEGRATARAVTGASNLAFLVLVLTGAYLWIPSSIAQLRHVIWFRRGLSAKARDFNWHNTIGAWSVLPLVVIVASGVVMSYPWANDVVYRLAGENPPARAAAPAAGERPTRTAAVAESPLLDAAWSRAAQQVPGWRSMTMRLPAPGARTAVVTIDRGDGGQPQKRGTLTLDLATGDVVRWEPFSALSTGRRLRSYLRFGHTGEAWGLPGQTVAGLASLGACVLAFTGVSLAVRRFGAWRTRRAR